MQRPASGNSTGQDKAPAGPRAGSRNVLVIALAALLLGWAVRGEGRQPSVGPDESASRLPLAPRSAGVSSPDATTPASTTPAEGANGRSNATPERTAPVPKPAMYGIGGNTNRIVYMVDGSANPARLIEAFQTASGDGSVHVTCICFDPDADAQTKTMLQTIARNGHGQFKVFEKPV